MSTTNPVSTPVLPPSWANRIAAIAAFLTGLAAAVAGIINVLPTAWQSTTIAIIGIIGAVSTCLHYMLGSQKYDAQVAQVLVAKHNADAAKALSSRPTVTGGNVTPSFSFPTPVAEIGSGNQNPTPSSVEVSLANEIVAELSPADKARLFMGTIMHYLHDHQSQIGYMEVRFPDDIMSSHGMSWSSFMAFIARGGRIVIDCSETVTVICRWGGLKDPNGPQFNYNGYGNTQTMMDYLPHIPLRDVHEGSIIVFGGPMNLQHAVMVLETNPNEPENPTVLSHGSAPVFIGPFSDVSPYFTNRGQPVVALSIAELLPKSVPSYHYERFDDTVRKLANDSNSERNVVENYDHYRHHPDLYAKELEVVKENLKVLISDLEVNMKATPQDDAKYHRFWRLAQLKDREAGKLVEPTL